MYRCSNKKCTSIKEGELQLQTGWKSSCCNLCDVPECPDYGICKCFEQGGRIITETISSDRIKELYKNSDIEIETFE